MKVKFRPHHFLCNLGFQGKGYSPEFIKNFEKINTYLSAQPDTEIEVVETLDDICSVCPENTGKSCKKQAKIDFIDQKHKAMLSLQHGDKVSWSEAKRRIKKIELSSFHEACEKCVWKPFGICEDALQKLKNSS